MQTDQSKTEGLAAVDLQRLVSTRYQFRTDFENHNISPVTFDRMRSPFYDGEKWAVRRNSSCLAKDGEWEYEPIPSIRDDEFYARCRFDSLAEALAAVERANDKHHRQPRKRVRNATSASTKPRPTDRQRYRLFGAWNGWPFVFEQP